MTTTRFALVLVALIVAKDAAASETAPLTCPAGAKLEILDGKRGRIEFCAKGETLHGPAREWYANGIQRTADNWRDGQQVGLWIVWDERGLKREERCYRAGKLDGRETYWHSNGKRRTVTHYAAGVKAGPIAEWDEEGEQIAAGQFEHGKAQGTWTFREPVTRETFKVVYENGEKLFLAPIAAGEFKEWVDQPSAPCGGV